jgi:N-acetylneuraminic acid mutarotase
MSRNFVLLWVLSLLPSSVLRAEPPPLPKAVTSFGAGVCAGGVYVYGGHAGKAHEYSTVTVSGALWRLSLTKQDAWEVLPGDVPVQSPGIVAWQDKLILAGGMQPQNAPGAEQKLMSLDHAALFDPTTKSWAKLPPLPEPRSSHALAVIGDQLYAVGGWPLKVGVPKEEPKPDAPKTKKWHDTMVVLDLTKPEAGWKTLPQPWTRRALAAVVFGGKLWCIGGMTEDNDLSSVVDIYDPATQQWTSAPPVGETERAKAFGCAACVVGGSLYVSPEGGKVYRIGADAKQWSECGKLAQSRYFHQLIALDDTHLMALGGTSGGKPMDDVEIVTVEPNKPAP